MRDKTIAMILGGGVGSRLYPLTLERSKPAVPVAGKYRLIDIPISNCLNSNITRMFVLTQFNSASLNQHVKNTYHFDIFSKGFVDILAAEQTHDNSGWFQGTADAVRQSLQHLKTHDYEYLMILSGDQLYQMDLEEMIAYHEAQGADLTVATVPVVAGDAPGFGIMKVSGDGYIQNFVEKPPLEEVPQWASEVPEKYAKDEKFYLANMGIYVFSKKVLWKLFEENPDAMDYGKEIIPYAVTSENYTVASFPYGGYWTDIGSIPSFFSANLELTEYLPEFNLYDNHNQIYTRPRMLAPSKVFGTRLDHALISDGCIIHATHIENAVVGIRSRIGKQTFIKNAIILGNDYYQSLKDLKEGTALLGIGDNCHIENTILDKNVRIGNNVIIKGHSGLEDTETDQYCIRSGIIIMKKGANLQDGARIGV